ncbi:helix-turn-helix transcriptional regulator [Paenibacillus guangzhouensis]|uniref:helix-turn-helix transcriptional regulator n=1 Tax=Paenibacillus guangzhouensis TaxID=1473112 RepID=UPI001267125E|nr:YafY family protein [Paenibacillus guangzhouensis]
MNQAERRLALIGVLQRSGMQRAKDLAATFRTSARTIYRDVDALIHAGVPIYGAPGRGYALANQEALPPVSLTAEEALTLLLGIDWIAGQLGPDYRAAAEQIRGKVEGILPSAVKRKADRQRAGLLRASIHPLHQEETLGVMALLRQAIVRETTVRFRYERRDPYPDGTLETVRSVDPYGLVFAAGAWSVMGYCHLRQGIRQFHIDRVFDLVLEPRIFTRPLDVEFHRPAGKNRSMVVIVRFAGDMGHVIAERLSPDVTRMQRTADGWIVTLHVSRMEDACAWILSWGVDAEVLEPEEVKVRIGETASAMLSRYSSGAH